MNEDVLVKQMIEKADDVPSHAEVLALRQHSFEDIKRRGKEFLDIIAKAYALSLDRTDSVVKKDRTLIRLPKGARAILYHASGTMKFATGLQPMESLFGEKFQDKETVTKLVEEVADRLEFRRWAGNNESIEFEHLWQIKAAAANQQGQIVNPVLCRVVGAYRHYIGKLPVWGAASVAIKLAKGGVLDSLVIQLRETTGEIIERSKILPPEQAARQICLQLHSLTGNSRMSFDETVKAKWLRFGYLSLGKRKCQRLLAPVYLAAIEIKGEKEAEARAYLFATPATEKIFLPLERNGADISPARRPDNT